MFKKRIGIIAGWKEAFGIIEKEKLNFTKYILIKIGLRIIAGIIGGLLCLPYHIGHNLSFSHNLLSKPNSIANTCFLPHIQPEIFGHGG